MRSKKLLLYIPALAWMAFIFFLSAQPTTGIGQTRTSRFLILKTFHLIEYATLFVLIYLANKRAKPSALFSYLYALSDEFHQTLVPGREGRFTDTLIDLMGILIAIFVIHLLGKWVKLSAKPKNS